MKYIVTLKIKEKENHSSMNKITKNCHFSLVCTDSTGAHHSILVEGTSVKDAEDLVQLYYGQKTHITRTEEVLNSLKRH